MNRFNFAKDVTSGIATVAGAVTMFSKSKTSKEKSELEKKDTESKIASREEKAKTEKRMLNVSRMNARSAKTRAEASLIHETAYSMKIQQAYEEYQGNKNSPIETTNNMITGESEVENGINND